MNTCSPYAEKVSTRPATGARPLVWRPVAVDQLSRNRVHRKSTALAAFDTAGIGDEIEEGEERDGHEDAGEPPGDPAPGPLLDPDGGDRHHLGVLHRRSRRDRLRCRRQIGHLGDRCSSRNRRDRRHRCLVPPLLVPLLLSRQLVRLPSAVRRPPSLPSRPAASLVVPFPEAPALGLLCSRHRPMPPAPAPRESRRHWLWPRRSA